MSTAGKVLTVLVLLVTVGWIVMLSAVEQLNENWEKKIEAQQQSIDQATEELAKAKDQVLSVTELARVKQDETGREKRVLEVQITAAERERSSKIEDLSRVKAQLNDALKADETSKANLGLREAEKIANQEGLAKKRDEVAKAKAVNADLRTQLAQLQVEFKRILAENAARLAEAAKAGTAIPASTGRPSPSS